MLLPLPILAQIKNIFFGGGGYDIHQSLQGADWFFNSFYLCDPGDLRHSSGSSANGERQTADSSGADRERSSTQPIHDHGTNNNNTYPHLFFPGVDDQNADRECSYTKPTHDHDANCPCPNLFVLWTTDQGADRSNHGAGAAIARSEIVAQMVSVHVMAMRCAHHLAKHGMDFADLNE